MAHPRVPGLSDVLLSGLLLFLLPGLAHAQAPEEPAALRGFVRSGADGQSLQGANVVLRDTTGRIAHAVVTDADGFYQITGIAAGRYELGISFVGHQQHSESFDLQAGAQQTVTVSLPSAPHELDDVTVEGRRPVEEAEAGVRRIRSTEIESIPTAGPGSDLSSYLRGLPGVTTTGDRGGRMYVRGGTPSQNLVLVDGMALHKPFHIIGLYSAVPGDLVSTAEFYAGGYGAEYMGRISSVLDVQLRPGNTEAFRASVGGGPFLSSARVEGPFKNGSSSYLLHARHSLIEHSGPAVLNQRTPYKFYDVTAKYHTQGESHQCSVAGMRTYDRGQIDPGQDASFRWSNSALGGKCLIFGNTSSQVLDVKFGMSRFSNSVTSLENAQRTAGTWRFYTKLDFSQPAFSGNTMKWGIHFRTDQYRINVTESFLGIASESYFRITAAPYIGTELSWRDRFSLTPSLGTQFQFSRGLPSLEPRLRFSYRPGGSNRMKLTAAGGLYRQFVNGIADERDAGTTFQALMPSPFENHPSQSIHGLVGWNQQLSEHFRVSVEGWYKQLQNLSVPRWTPIVRFNTNLARADGTAYGADLSTHYERGRVRLGVTYGYGKTTYQASEEDIGAWTGDAVVRYTPPHDLRHKLGLTTSLDLHWMTASARWQYNSGLPFTRVYGFDAFLDMRGLRDRPFENPGTNRTLFDRPYGARLAPYHRLDVSLEKTIDITPTLAVSTEVGAINAYDRTNLFYFDIFTRDRVDQLPLIPYVSLQVNIR